MQLASSSSCSGISAAQWLAYLEGGGLACSRGRLCVEERIFYVISRYGGSGKISDVLVWVSARVSVVFGFTECDYREQSPLMGDRLNRWQREDSGNGQAPMRCCSFRVMLTDTLG
nr:hypothetical protein Iba_chr05eCG9260 [Ipomoea batatas]